MVPFGFSAGDFVALGGLVIKVTKALKDHGGATEEHQHVVFELLPEMSVVMSLEITLSAFTHFVWDDDDSSFLAAKCVRCEYSLRDMSGLIGSKGLPSPASWEW